MPNVTTAEPSKKDATIHVRARRETRDLIDRAAAASHKTLTAFVLDAARREAEDVLRDRTLITLSPGDYDAFVAALDGPPKPRPNLTKLLREPDPWYDAPAGGPE